MKKINIEWIMVGFGYYQTLVYWTFRYIWGGDFQPNTFGLIAFAIWVSYYPFFLLADKSFLKSKLGAVSWVMFSCLFGVVTMMLQSLLAAGKY
jgi:hypothetical protein